MNKILKIIQNYSFLFVTKDIFLVSATKAYTQRSQSVCMQSKHLDVFQDSNLTVILAGLCKNYLGKAAIHLTQALYEST